MRTLKAVIKAGEGWPRRRGSPQPAGQCGPAAAAAATAQPPEVGGVGKLRLRFPAEGLLAGGAADAQSAHHERPEPHQPVWLP